MPTDIIIQVTSVPVENHALSFLVSHRQYYLAWATIYYVRLPHMHSRVSLLLINPWGSPHGLVVSVLDYGPTGRRFQSASYRARRLWHVKDPVPLTKRVGHRVHAGGRFPPIVSSSSNHHS